MVRVVEKGVVKCMPKHTQSEKCGGSEKRGKKENGRLGG